MNDSSWLTDMFKYFGCLSRKADFDSLLSKSNYTVIEAEEEEQFPVLALRGGHRYEELATSFSAIGMTS